MTLGHVYDLDLRRNEALIKEVIIQAQGEVCLFDVTNALCAYLTALIRWPSRSISDKSRKPGRHIILNWSTTRIRFVWSGMSDRHSFKWQYQIIRVGDGTTSSISAAKTWTRSQQWNCRHITKVRDLMYRSSRFLQVSCHGSLWGGGKPPRQTNSTFT